MRRKFTLPLMVAAASVAVAITVAAAGAARASIVPASELAPYAGTGNAPFLYHLNGDNVSSGFIANYGTYGSAGNLTNLNPSETFVSSVNGAFGDAQSGQDANGFDTAQVPLSSMTDASGSFTAEAIFQMPNSPPTTTQFNIVSYGGSNEPTNTAGEYGTWYISYNDARMQFVINNRERNSTGGFNRDTIMNYLPAVSLTAGDWYHVAMAWDNTTNVAHTYLTQLTGTGANNDGEAVLLATVNGNGDAMSLTSDAYRLAVGDANDPDGGNGFAGSGVPTIDEVRIRPGVHSTFSDLAASIPVPEPASLGLAGVGAIGLLLLGRRRKTA